MVSIKFLYGDKVQRKCNSSDFLPNIVTYGSLLLIGCLVGGLLMKEVERNKLDFIMPRFLGKCFLGTFYYLFLGYLPLGNLLSVLGCSLRAT